MSEKWDLEKSGPATVAEAITPADSADLSWPTRAIYLGSAGDVKVQMHGGGEIVTFSGLLAGQLYPFGVTKVFSGGTTASSIVALR